MASDMSQVHSSFAAGLGERLAAVEPQRRGIAAPPCKESAD